MKVFFFATIINPLNVLEYISGQKNAKFCTKEKKTGIPLLSK
jgi:hypothetical protein